MKKVFLILQRSDGPNALEALRQLGTVHVEHQQAPAGKDVSELKSDVALLHQAIGILGADSGADHDDKVSDWKKLSQEIVCTHECISQLQEQIFKRAHVILQWEPWGQFDLSSVHDLEAKGIYLNFLKISKQYLRELPKDIIVEIIRSEGPEVYCVAISKARIRFGIEPLALPAMSLNEMKALQKSDEHKIKQLKQQLKEQNRYHRFLHEVLGRLSEELRLKEVWLGMGETEGLCFLKGFCPLDQCDALKKISAKQRWGLLVEDPSGEDTVPTLVRNPRWVAIIKPMFSMMNIIPGYKERDISPFFLIFFSIFFGILVGDAGYGMLFLLMNIFAHKKFGNKIEDKAIFFLLYVLSGVTIIWGLLTGTIFGTVLFGQAVKPILPWLTEVKNLQFLCFLLGAIHLTLAHIWRFVNKGPTLSGFSEAGWILMIWGSFFLANMMIVGMALPGFVKYFYIIGMLLVVIDVLSQGKDIGVNLILFVFSVIGAFTDVVSYIRLFAVGVATVAVADAFNQMALSLGFKTILGAVGASLILVFVHLFLNIALCMMGVLVHGVRLNVLEFSGHLGMEWSGIKYEPFVKSKQVNI